MIVSRRHLDAVLAEFVRHYNRARPHRGLELLTPEPRVSVTPTKLVPRFRTRKVLGGLINEYEIAA
ncbi:MAG: transposase [Actinobacteria bacterium]|nr:transposase [Actinomycetota bacterium]